MDIMRFMDIDINSDIIKGQHNWSKILSMDILSLLINIICDVLRFICMNLIMSIYFL